MRPQNTLRPAIVALLGCAVLLLGTGLSAPVQSVAALFRKGALLDPLLIFRTFAGWLVLALEFLLVADILRTAISPTELSDSDREDERSQRALVLAALKKYTHNRFHLGEALASYKQAFKTDRIWLRASEAIAKHMNMSQRTLFRILSDYERVSGLPVTVLSAMEAEGIDPAKRKNAPLLEEISEAISEDPLPEEAQEVVRRKAASLKQRKRKDPISEDDRIVLGLRTDIRKWLDKVPDDRQWPLLQRAISEELYEVWGVVEPFDVTITPTPTNSAIDGRQQKTQAVAA